MCPQACCQIPIHLLVEPGLQAVSGWRHGRQLFPRLEVHSALRGSLSNELDYSCAYHTTVYYCRWYSIVQMWTAILPATQAGLDSTRPGSSQPNTWPTEIDCEPSPVAMGGYRCRLLDPRPTTQLKCCHKHPALHLLSKTNHSRKLTVQHPHGEGVAEDAGRNQIYTAASYHSNPPGILRTQSAPLPQQPSYVLPPSPNTHVLAV